MNDSTLDGIKVNAYELGWRFTGDNLRTQVAASTRSRINHHHQQERHDHQPGGRQTSYLWG
ncbi:hypothetical protein ACVXG7_19195 [Enterobacter hormaechei]